MVVTFADSDKIVSITLPGTNETKTATCGQWFRYGCTFFEPDDDICSDYQTALDECCTDAPPSPTPAPAPT